MKKPYIKKEIREIVEAMVKAGKKCVIPTKDNPRFNICRKCYQTGWCLDEGVLTQCECDFGQWIKKVYP